MKRTARGQDLVVNGPRLLQSLERLGRIGWNGEEAGITRLAFSDEDRQARRFFLDELAASGYACRIDAAGNIFGVRPGGAGGDAPVTMGSHLDTVRQAGAYDGAYGVLAGLEVLRTLDDLGIATRHPLAVANFVNEEGARFQPDMMGSMILSGALSLEEARTKRDDAGISVGEELDRGNYAGADRVFPRKYLELHVEQGPILEAEDLQIGVVEGVQGIAWWQGFFLGQAAHAGCTPLALRKDALLGAADLALAVRALAEELGDGSVATMGRCAPEPDVINVVPGSARFTLDFRSYDPERFERGKILVEELVRSVAFRNGLEYRLEQVANALPVRFDPTLVALVEQSARERRYTYRRMRSGAGHDAQLLALVCPAAMLFIPSVGGVSHTPKEYSAPEDLVRGANVLLSCALALAEPL
jgi:N-carbamoyl-L-amino-acid hydrolase